MFIFSKSKSDEECKTNLITRQLTSRRHLSAEAAVWASCPLAAFPLVEACPCLLVASSFLKNKTFMNFSKIKSSKYTEDP